MFTVCSGECATVHQGVTPPLGVGGGATKSRGGGGALLRRLSAQ